MGTMPYLRGSQPCVNNGIDSSVAAVAVVVVAAAAVKECHETHCTLESRTAAKTSSKVVKPSRFTASAPLSVKKMRAADWLNAPLSPWKATVTSP